MNGGGPGTFSAESIVSAEVPPATASEPGVVARALVGLLRFYQRFISPLIPPSCRFAPSCSEYAVRALSTHGVVYGTWLTVRRLLRCAPWHPGGWDPVPPRRSRTSERRTADMLAEENV